MSFSFNITPPGTPPSAGEISFNTPPIDLSKKRKYDFNHPTPFQKEVSTFAQNLSSKIDQFMNTHTLEYLGEGVHKTSYKMINTTSSSTQTEVVAKIFKDSCIEDNGTEIKNFIKTSLNQYYQLKKDFPENPPIAQLIGLQDDLEKDFNTIIDQGYFLQEKVTPLCKNDLWNKTTSISELSTEQLKILNEVKSLFHYTFNSFETGLDLKIENLGFQNRVVLFDFMEHDDAFYLFARESLNNLSQENQSIREYLLEGLNPQNEFLSECLEHIKNNTEYE